MSLEKTVKDSINKVLSKPNFEYQLCLRIIDFADYATEGVTAIRASKFFMLPDENEELQNYVAQIDNNNRGAACIAGNGLEALWIAMKHGYENRANTTLEDHIIFLVTNAPPLNLGERKDCVGYVVDDYPKNLKEMETIWNGISMTADTDTNQIVCQKYLCLIVPNGSDNAGHTWEQFEKWENSVVRTFDYERGVDEDSFIYPIINNLMRTYEKETIVEEEKNKKILTDTYFVFCIDVTAGNSPWLELTKKLILKMLTYYNDFVLSGHFTGDGPRNFKSKTFRFKFILYDDKDIEQSPVYDLSDITIPWFKFLESVKIKLQAKESNGWAAILDAITDVNDTLGKVRYNTYFAKECQKLI